MMAYRGIFAAGNWFGSVFTNTAVNNNKTLGTLFKGREDFLEKIRTTLSQAEYRGHQRVAAITSSAAAATVHGLGGIGKTRAIEFAHKCT